MTRTTRVLTTAAVVALAALLPGCSDSAEPEPTPSATMTEAVPEEPTE